MLYFRCILERPVSLYDHDFQVYRYLYTPGRYFSRINGGSLVLFRLCTILVCVEFQIATSRYQLN